MAQEVPVPGPHGLRVSGSLAATQMCTSQEYLAIGRCGHGAACRNLAQCSCSQSRKRSISSDRVGELGLFDIAVLIGQCRTASAITNRFSVPTSVTRPACMLDNSAARQRATLAPSAFWPRPRHRIWTLIGDRPWPTGTLNEISP